MWVVSAECCCSCCCTNLFCFVSFCFYSIFVVVGMGCRREAMDSFCRPVEGGVWDTKLASGFGPYTPCLLDTVVINFSNLTLICICLTRIRCLLYNRSTTKFRLKSQWGHYVAILLATFAAAEPVVQIILGISAVNGDGETSLPPFEVTILCPLSFPLPNAWFLVLHMCMSYKI